MIPLIPYFVSLLAVAGILGLIQPKREALPTFFEEQNFNITHATILLILVWLPALIYLYPISRPNPMIIILTDVLPAPMLFIAISIFFHFWLRQSLTVIGLSKHEWANKMLLGLKWILTIITTIMLCDLIILLLLDDATLGSIKDRVMNFIHSSALIRFQAHIYLLGLPAAIPVVSLRTILISSIEEILFRGIYYSALRKKLNILPAICISSLVFTLWHGRIDWTIFAAGCLYAYLYEKTHSLFPSISAHITYNLFIYMFALWSSTGLKHLDVRAFFAYVLLALSPFLLSTWTLSYYFNKAEKRGVPVV